MFFTLNTNSHVHTFVLWIIDWFFYLFLCDFVYCWFHLVHFCSSFCPFCWNPVIYIPFQTAFQTLSLPLFLMLGNCLHCFSGCTFHGASISQRSFHLDMCQNRASKYMELGRGSQSKHRITSCVFRHSLDRTATEEHNDVRTKIMTKVIYDWFHIPVTCSSGVEADLPSRQGGTQCSLLVTNTNNPRINP